MTDPIVVEDLRKVFGETVAVDGVSLTVAAGSVVGVLGPNGAGKTTMINCLTTLLRPDGGRVSVAGHDVVAEPAQVRGSVALTGQFAAVDDALTARENLVLFGRLLRLGKAAARARADELLGRFDLSDAAARPVATLSGGQRRRLDLAISLVVERPVLVLDEPTTGLDPRSRQELWQVVRDVRAAGTAVLLTTQYLEEADRLADRILLLDAGKVVAQGSPAELKTELGGSVCEIHLVTAEDGRRAGAALADLRPELADEARTVLVPAEGTGTLAEVVRRLDAAGVQPEDVALRRPTLDEVFLARTGVAARGAAPADRARADR